MRDPRTLGPVAPYRPLSLADLLRQDGGFASLALPQEAPPNSFAAAAGGPAPQAPIATQPPERLGFFANLASRMNLARERARLQNEQLKLQNELARIQLPASAGLAQAQTRQFGELGARIASEADPRTRESLIRGAATGEFRPFEREPGPAELSAYQTILGMTAEEARQKLIGQREEKQARLGAQLDSFLIQQRLRAGVEEERQKRALGPAPASIGDANALRDDFRQDSKAYVTIRDSWKRLQSVAQEPSAAGDLALLFNYMKILDPGSVVRESEFANAETAASIPERIRGQWERVRSGQRLAPEVRDDFVQQASNLVQAQEGLQRRLESQYGSIAQRSGIRPEDVVIDYTGGQGEPPARRAAAPPESPRRATLEELRAEQARRRGAR